ncbi:hypothetical protein [Leuconostoc mesenteroides]|uniref:hypothetical protein n=1 Tax=Leuconostoc mesenteroides TaxID=1245 RepID=UPI00235F81A9|nr:hypothetical protein [Leuconostoc mesenteroides]
MNFIEDLKWRGALNQVTDEAGLLEAMSNDKIGAYVGTDLAFFEKPRAKFLVIKDSIFFIRI